MAAATAAVQRRRLLRMEMRWWRARHPSRWVVHGVMWRLRWRDHKPRKSRVGGRRLLAKGEGACHTSSSLDFEFPLSVRVVSYSSPELHKAPPHSPCCLCAHSVRAWVCSGCLMVGWTTQSGLSRVAHSLPLVCFHAGRGHPAQGWPCAPSGPAGLEEATWGRWRVRRPGAQHGCPGCLGCLGRSLEFEFPLSVRVGSYSSPELHMAPPHSPCCLCAHSLRAWVCSGCLMV